MNTIVRIFICLLLFNYAVGQTPKIVSYNDKPVLTWSDFKVPDFENDLVNGFLFNCTIQMKTVKVNIWTGKATFEAYGIYYPTLSGVKNELKSDSLLSYFQLQFDIAHAIAGQLESKINSKNINGAHKKKMDKIFEEYETKVDRVLQKMDQETNFGRNADELALWRIKLKEVRFE